MNQFRGVLPVVFVLVGWGLTVRAGLAGEDVNAVAVRVGSVTAFTSVTLPFLVGFGSLSRSKAASVSLGTPVALATIALTVYGWLLGRTELSYDMRPEAADVVLVGASALLPVAASVAGFSLSEYVDGRPLRAVTAGCVSAVLIGGLSAVGISAGQVSATTVLDETNLAVGLIVGMLLAAATRYSNVAVVSAVAAGALLPFATGVKESGTECVGPVGVAVCSHPAYADALSDRVVTAQYEQYVTAASEVGLDLSTVHFWTPGQPYPETAVRSVTSGLESAFPDRTVARQAVVSTLIERCGDQFEDMAFTVADWVVGFEPSTEGETLQGESLPADHAERGTLLADLIAECSPDST